jgi:hypothetical protein
MNLCVLIFDDIIVVGWKFLEQVNNLRNVFQIFLRARPKLKPKKCPLSQKEVRELGNVLLPKAMTRDPDKLEA